MPTTTAAPLERITDDELETVEAIIRNGQSGRVTDYEWKQIIAELRAWREAFPVAGFDGRSIVLSGRQEKTPVMKLFIWEGDGVLENYTSGLIVAVAEDLQGALSAIRAKYAYCMNSFPNDQPSQVIDLAANPSHVEAWLRYGGG